MDKNTSGKYEKFATVTDLTDRSKTYWILLLEYLKDVLFKTDIKNKKY